MSILLTGGTGFVGLNVADALLADGIDVVIFGQVPPPAALLDRLTDLPGRLEVEIGDIRSASRLNELFARHRPDKVVHGAAITAGLDREQIAARTIMEVNLGGTIELLEAALRHRAGRVVVLGTGSVFGTHDPEGPPLDERRDIPVPESLYGITKYAAERTALRYRDTRCLDACVARLGVTFGRYEYDTGVRDTLSVPLQLLQAAERGQKVRVRRELPDDWVYATDVADAIVRLLAISNPQPVYHVSAGRRWSVGEWCGLLKSAFPDFSFKLVDDDAGANIGVPAPRRRPRFLIERLQADTGYRPRFDPAAAFADYLDWHRHVAR